MAKSSDDGAAYTAAKDKNQVVKKNRGGALTYDDAKQKTQVVKKAGGGAVGSDKSPFSSAGGGKASTSPYSSACRK